MVDARGAGVAADTAAPASASSAEQAELAALREQVHQQRRVTAAISEFAIAFTSIRENIEVLQQLVARARSLVEADMAYLTLIGSGERGQARVVATDGVWTEEYRTLRIPFGAGLLGRVISSDGPVQTRNYGEDTQLAHDAQVDRIVVAEGVRALLGVPMRVRGKIIGALLVANRYDHEFDPDQLFIAQILANLAAVAVDNMRQREGLSAAAAELQSQQDATLRELALERRLVRADEALMEAIAGHEGIASLRDGIVRALGRDVQLIDLTIRHDLRSDTVDSGDAVRPLIMLSAQTDSAMSSEFEDGTPIEVMAAVRDGEPIGAVLALGQLGAGDDIVLRRCARVLGAFIRAQARERGDVARRQRDLVETLLAPPPSGLGATVLGQLAQLGLLPGAPYRILIADGSRSSVRDFEHRLELDFGPTLLRGTIDDQLVMVVPERAFERMRDSLESRGARRHGGLLVAHTPTLHQFEIVPEEFALLQRVLGAARQTDHHGTLVSLASYGAIGAFLSTVTLDPTKQALTDVLRPLLDYDRANGTSLVETAGAFLDAGQSVARTAAALHIHDNTVRQRLDRIAAILGRDWSIGQSGLDLHIMLAVNRLIGDDR